MTNIQSTTIDKFWNLNIEDIKIDIKRKYYSIIFSRGKRNRILNIKEEGIKKIFKTKEKEKIKEIYNKMSSSDRENKIKNVPHSFVEYGIIDNIFIIPNPNNKNGGI